MTMILIKETLQTKTTQYEWGTCHRNIKSILSVKSNISK